MALNEMYELPQPQECSDRTWKNRLRWTRSGNGKTWKRYVWQNDNNGGGDAYHRGLRDRKWRGIEEYLAVFGKVPSSVTLWHMAALFALGVLGYGTWNRSDFGGGLGGAVFAALNLVAWMIGKGATLALTASQFIFKGVGITLSFALQTNA